MDRLSFYQVLLFRDKKKVEEFTPALWAAFKELEEIFGLMEKEARFRRIRLNGKMRDDTASELELDWKAIGEALEADQWWARAEGKYPNTFDHVKLLSQARELLGRRA